jgi:hypothetical protein
MKLLSAIYLIIALAITGLIWTGNKGSFRNAAQSRADWILVMVWAEAGFLAALAWF